MKITFFKAQCSLNTAKETIIMIEDQVEAIEVGPPIANDSPERLPVEEVLKSCIAVY